MLGPGTSWRQGHVLKHEDAVSMNLLKSDDNNMKVVVITHDCDLQSMSEQNIELLVGPLKKSSSQRVRAKHPRILDLCYENPIGPKLNAIELRHETKVIMPKQEFHCEESDSAFTISDKEKDALKQWLAAKYGRPAFPNAFEERIRAYDVKKEFNFEAEIASILAAREEHLIGVFFDLGNNRFNDIEEGEPYELSIVVVYDATDGGPVARQHAEDTCAALKTLFMRFYGDPEQGLCQLIELQKCSPIADTHFPLSALRRMDQWRVEYISLEDDSSGSFIGAGV